MMFRREGKGERGKGKASEYKIETFSHTRLIDDVIGLSVDRLISPSFLR